MVGLVTAQQEFLKEETDSSWESVITNRFGNFERMIKDDIMGFEKEILLKSNNHLYFDYQQQKMHLDELTSFYKGEKKFTHPKDLRGIEESCHTWRSGPKDPDAQFMFLPAFTGQIADKSPKISFEGNCFKNIEFDFNYDKDELTANLDVTTSGKRSELCSDFFLFANTEVYHVEDFRTEGKHSLKFKVPEAGALDMFANGMETYLFCESLKDELLSVITSLKAYIGGLGLHGKIPLFSPKVPEYMEEANLNFMKWAVNVEFEKRDTQKVEIDESLIQSGDYIAIMRLDGLDPMIMYGTGSRSGHSVMAMRFDGELYIVESQDAWYWPVHRIQRNKFSEWIKYAENCDFNVVHMPLSDEFRQKFNETAA